MHRITTSQAPGKLILSGEHAVVYGCPALVTAVDRYACCRVAFSSSGAVTFYAPQLKVQCSYTFQHLEDLLHQTDERYQEFLRGSMSIKQVLNAPLELAAYVLALTMESADIKTVKGLDITLTSDIPMGCGMGSSAAIIVCLLMALHRYYDLPLTAESCYVKALRCENMQHGYSSGIDIYASIHRRAFLYDNIGTIIPVDLPPRPLIVANTGTPVTSTGECVSAVNRNFGRDTEIWKRFSNTTREMVIALEADDAERVRCAVHQNHLLLSQIGVVPDVISQWINTQPTVGKICGAGSIRGNEAGMVWLLDPLKNTDYPLEKLMPLFN
ncbi:MAG: hypothetical protein EOL87_08630 [Spartobacteria bacterium]|nr:hypothetical protein [Spartobacteria bacterium]